MSIQPFKVNIPQETLDGLRDRLACTQWTEMPHENPEFLSQQLIEFFGESAAPQQTR